MNKYSKRHSDKAKDKAHAMLASAHILIAVVALIECLILISFTTYSWIESASSLVIMNGPQSTTTTGNVNVDIAKQLNYRVDLDSTAGQADLNTFFSGVKYYKYGRGSSPDGTTFYFPKRNNTYTTAETFRLGDTTDYNTSYTYLDFKIYNTLNNKDFYFDDTDDLEEVFTCEDPTGTLSPDQKDAVENAMRISITDSSVTNGTHTYIYSKSGRPYRAQNSTEATAQSTTTEIKTGDGGILRKISDYLPDNATKALGEKNVLFSARKCSKEEDATTVSIRIWFEIMDEDFHEQFGFSSTTHNFEDPAFKALGAVNIKINFAFANSDNNYQPFYFDDYTFSTASGNEGGNITMDNAANTSYAVWCHTYNPDLNNGSGGYTNYVLSVESTDGGRTRWSAEQMPLTVTDFLKNTATNGTDGLSATQLKNSYFAYGTFNKSANTEGTILYKWKFEKPSQDIPDYIYNAYSVTDITSSTTGTATSTYGAGGWNYTTPVSLLRFDDKGTALTQVAYNGDADGDHNYQVLNNKSVNTLFVNTYSSFRPTSYSSDIYTSVNEYIASTTAKMYFDGSVFKAYVPTAWFDSAEDTVYFYYCSEGKYSACDMSWAAAGPSRRTSDNTYTYTNLGQGENYYFNYYVANKSYIAPSIGTWNDVERINFSTELIDYDMAPAYRYKVAIPGSDFDSTAKDSYPLIPDASGINFYAYIPAGLGSEGHAINFLCMNNNFGNGVHARWYADQRRDSTTFYPVEINADVDTATDTMFTRGYWNLSVLVDGTYENLIYDTVTDDAYGTLEYSTDGTNFYTLMNDSDEYQYHRIDRQRWYVPCNANDTVYYRWTPYDGTTFTYTHNTSEGMYYVVVEAEDRVIIADGTASAVPVLSRLSRLSEKDFSAYVRSAVAAEQLAAEEESAGTPTESIVDDIAAAIREAATQTAETTADDAPVDAAPTTDE